MAPLAPPPGRSLHYYNHRQVIIAPAIEILVAPLNQSRLDRYTNQKVKGFFNAVIDNRGPKKYQIQ